MTNTTRSAHLHCCSGIARAAVLRRLAVAQRLHCERRPHAPGLLVRGMHGAPTDGLSLIEVVGDEDIWDFD